MPEVVMMADKDDKAWDIYEKERSEAAQAEIEQLQHRNRERRLSAALGPLPSSNGIECMHCHRPFAGDHGLCEYCLLRD